MKARCAEVPVRGVAALSALNEDEPISRWPGSSLVLLTFHSIERAWVIVGCRSPGLLSTLDSPEFGPKSPLKLQPAGAASHLGCLGWALAGGTEGTVPPASTKLEWGGFLRTLVSVPSRISRERRHGRCNSDAAEHAPPLGAGGSQSQASSASCRCRSVMASDQLCEACVRETRQCRRTLRSCAMSGP